ncbi:putative D,D-dipeptide ABC transporter membrane subunit DdpB [Hyphomicrobiales bacterium]|nr:putative D,D-dipeptide ABC transporter membrane subunit DdpB [Hyphomicrobiales bacterium]
MIAYLCRRIAGTALVMLFVVTLTFVIVRIVPGDPAAVMLGNEATPQQVAELRRQLGLEQPLAVQFGVYLLDLARGDLGRSIFLNRSVLTALSERAELTLSLTGLSITLAALIGIPLGVIAAVFRGRPADQGVMTLAMVGASIPSFWIGLTLIKYMAVDLRWFPVSGYGPPDASFAERLHYLILPAVALALPNSALILRFTRVSMVEILHNDYVRTARAKGLSQWGVVMRHAFRNALTPIITVLGLTIATLIGGAIVTETVFGLPGVGNLITSAVMRRDYPVIQGALLVISGLYVFLNMAIDVIYAMVDPRIRY